MELGNIKLAMNIPTTILATNNAKEQTSNAKIIIKKLSLSLMNCQIDTIDHHSTHIPPTQSHALNHHQQYSQYYKSNRLEYEHHICLPLYSLTHSLTYLSTYLCTKDNTSIATPTTAATNSLLVSWPHCHC